MLGQLLADARVGRARVVAVVGEPGIGKTALLDLTAELAEGMQVLRARGIESEADVPFAGLLELLRPALGVLDRVPGPQALALQSALALRPGGAVDRFAVGAATLSLLAAYAEERAVLVLIDDAHWLDTPSADALLFAFRRLLADPVAVVLAARDAQPSLLDGSDLPLRHLAGLERGRAIELLGRAAGMPVSVDIAERLYVATAGNPLALLEIAPSAEQLTVTGIEVPVPVSSRITEAFIDRSAPLPERTRRAMVLAAAADAGDTTVLARASASLGLALTDLLPAEKIGLVRVREASVEFRHPLARAAIYNDAPVDERRAAHRALALALPDRDADRRAWHLAAAAVGPDEAAAAALREAGLRARGRSAYSTAASAFERAARLTSNNALGLELLHAAAHAAWLGGAAERAEALVEEARALEPEGLLEAQIERLRGELRVRRGPVMEGHRVLVGAAELAAAAGAPELGAMILADAAAACFYAGEAATMAATTARGLELLPSDPRVNVGFACSVAHGMALVLVGDGEAGARRIRGALADLDASADLQRDPALLRWAALGALWLRDAGSRAVIDRAVTEGRNQAAVAIVADLLQLGSRFDATADRWPAAVAGFHEAIVLARDTRSGTDLAATLSGLAWVEARQGKEEECRAHAAEAEAVAAGAGVGTHRAWTLAALADLELGLGRPDVALEHLADLRSLLAELGIDDVDLSPGPELVEIMVRRGEAEEATRIAADYAAQAEAKGQPWSRARAARCAGLLAADEDLDRCFSAALVLHAQTPDAFERARTHFAYGVRLRRARRRVRAREELRAAHEIFDRLGARPWVAQAEAELAATGETARRRDVSTLDQLTPQEHQVASLLSRGYTTREAAAQLFLSPKTVEYHLRHVYQKLGIRSRAELASAFSTD